MRLTALELMNFKGIGTRQRIEMKPITLLFGPNSAGKSTILQALHYVREILERKNVDPDMTIAGGFLDLGGFKSVVHKHDLGQPMRIALEVELSPFEPIEHLPINSDGPDAVGGDFSGLDILYIAWEGGSASPPSGTLHNVALDLELRWSAQHLAPYVARWGVAFNNEPVAAISSVPEEGRAILSQFNFEHPLLAPILSEFDFEHSLLAPELQEDDTLRPSPLETLLRELSREMAIHESKASLSPIDARVAVKTVFGALPDLNEDLTFDLRDPDVRKFELEGKSPRAYALTALLSEFMLGPARIIRDYLARMTYIGPLRDIPARDYIPQFSPDESRCAHGLAAWDLLHGARGRELIDKVNFWLFDKERLNSGYRLERADYRKIPSPSPIDVIFQRGVRDEDLPDLQELYEQYPIEQEVALRDIRTGTLVGPSDVGVGLSQLVPVVVSLVSGDDGLVAIEQPELHLHPAVQVGVADLLAVAATAQSADSDAERCLLIETHSEHIMLRLLRRIRETFENELPPGAPSLTPFQVAVIYVEPTEDVLRLTALRITPDGDFLDRWPRGFFEERGEELF
jgi:hypothetical protein